MTPAEMMDGLNRIRDILDHYTLSPEDRKSIDLEYKAVCLEYAESAAYLASLQSNIRAMDLDMWLVASDPENLISGYTARFSEMFPEQWRNSMLYWEARK